MRKRESEFALVLILGPAGPTAVHTPEICVGGTRLRGIG